MAKARGKKATAKKTAKSTKRIKAPRKPAPKHAAPSKKARRVSPPKTVAKASPPRRAASPKKPAPSKLAAFTAQIMEEEEEPVAVRSFIEARQGSQGSKEYLHKTGEVREKAGQEEPEDDDEEEDEGDSGGEPRLNPLAGPMAIPKPQHEEFQIAERAKPRKGKKAEKPEEFGQVELRQATASGGRMLTKAKPENLQRGAARIKPLASSGEDAHLTKAHDDRLDVPEPGSAVMDRASSKGKKDLMDFGDVVIAQQTRSGKRDVGKLTKKADDEEETDE